MSLRWLVVFGFALLGGLFANFTTQPVQAQAMLTVELTNNASLGADILTVDGFTVYRYLNDSVDDDSCATVCGGLWSAVTVDNGVTPTAGPGMSGTLGTIINEIGQTQVTYNGIPLYFFSFDTSEGDANGEGLNNLWFALRGVDKVQLSEGTALGDILTDENGNTLYRFLNDEENVSNCTGSCATTWPPLLVDREDVPTATTALSGTLGVIPSGGQFQVTYNGVPLYTFSNDTTPGDTTGQGVNNLWYIVQVGTRAVSNDPVEIDLTTNSGLGDLDILTANSGRTLYRFLNDGENTSNCNNNCAVTWPPLLVSDMVTPTTALSVTGTISTITRLDGSQQVTYNGLPLYTFSGDTQPGDANGQGVGNVWYVLQDYTGFVNNNPVQVDQTNNATLSADILTADGGRTVYRFLNDGENMSNCLNGCPNTWPPVLAGEGVTPMAGAGVTGNISTTTRVDGSKQVTYNGLPLYFYTPDTQPGDVNGQGVGSVWYVLQVASRFVNNDPVQVDQTNNNTLGNILTSDNGRTLYRFLNDTTENESNCTGGCANTWPPLLVSDMVTPTTGVGVTGMLSTTTRLDGSQQVTYNGVPLYFYTPDTQPGDTNGQGIGDVWYILQVATRFVNNDPVEVDLSNDATLGNILTSNNGFTLYRFLNDTTENESSCNGGCATTWPPLLVSDMVTPTAAMSVTGTLSTITRTDGSQQVTYNGVPLYFYSPDTQPGDTNGQGVGTVWYVVQLSTRFVGSNPVTIDLNSTGVLSDILTTNNGFTIYRFLNDGENTSNCIDGCANTWPPVIAGQGITPMAGTGVTGNIGTITRTDGSQQVTYNGLPLYFYSLDSSAGDTNGQGIGNVWYILQVATRFVNNDPVQVDVANDSTLGDILTANNGFTLYRFLNDGENTSNCTGGCANTWPPVLVGDGVVPTGGPGATGTFSVTIRLDGSRQVTYNNLPLYFYSQDSSAGETTGQGIGTVWYIVKPRTAFVGDNPVLVSVTENGELGSILTANGGFTLYRFTNDNGTMSTCYDGCANIWPPLLVGQNVTATPDTGVTNLFGVTVRNDGSRQVTYNGVPLYFYSLDSSAGDTNGQGVGGVWFVAINVAGADIYLPVVTR